jgi:prevent-host-death family protein
LHLGIEMTIMVIVSSQMVTTHGREWPVADAKAHFSEMIERALSEGPQVVTRKGKRTVVVVPVDEWERRVKRRGNLADFFAASPLRGSGLAVDRVRDVPRRVSL